MIGGLANFVLETATSPGTGAFILNGPETGRRPFSAAFRTGQAVFYFADDGSNAEWGLGTLTIGTPSTLARTTILGTTSGSTQALNFTGTVEVYNEIPAERIPVLDESGHLLVASITDWTSRQAVPASDADARYAKLFGDNKFYGVQYVYNTVYAYGTNPITDAGAINVSPHLISGYKGRTTAHFWGREVVGTSSYAVITVSYGDTEKARYTFDENGVIVTPNGTVALVSDIASRVSAEATQRSNVDITLQTNITNEITRAKGAENTLQANITNESSARAAADALKANLAGGNTFTGTQTINGTSPSTTAGTINDGPGLISGYAGRTQVSFWGQEVVGSSSRAVIRVSYNGEQKSWLNFNENGRVITSAGTCAFLDELPTSGTIAGGAYTKIGNVLWQTFFVSNVSSGQIIPFPMAFSGDAYSVHTTPMGTSNLGHREAVNSLTATGFTVRLYGTYDGMWVTAQGPA